MVITAMTVSWVRCRLPGGSYHVALWEEGLFHLVDDCLDREPDS